MHVLQDILFANNLPNVPKELYYRTNGVVYYDEEKKNLVIPKQIDVNFGTYFNYFSLNTWHSYCALDDLFLKIRGKGEFILTVMNSKLEIHTETLIERHVYLTNRVCEVTVEIPYSEHKGGILHFSIASVSDCQIESGCFYTTTKPVNEVKLGIVITHFNRKAYLLPAIKRINDQLLSDPEYGNHIDLVVVDNSRNVLPGESMGAKVIPNENYGGSGGFTRGLLYLKDHDYTHCLFMDDDASSEVESIIKTFRLLQYSITPRLAIAGSMLYEEHPTILHEKGALYEPLKLTPIHSGLNMTQFRDIQITDLGLYEPDYGAWWHFAFKISDVKYFPFPFFVKGDDMLFGLVNNFSIITVNGICTFGEDFSHKDGPLQRYLGMRAMLNVAAIYTDATIEQYIKHFLKNIIYSLLSYDYAIARASSVALQHFMQGPDYWLKHMTFRKIAKPISNLLTEGKMLPLELSKLNVEFVPFGESRWRKYFRKLTLNGFLLPGSLIKERIVFNKKMGRGVIHQLFRNKKVVYYSSKTGTGYVAEYNKKRFFQELLFAFQLMMQLMLNFEKIKKQYKEAAPKIMSESFWRKVYADSLKTEQEFESKKQCDNVQDLNIKSKPVEKPLKEKKLFRFLKHKVKNIN